MDEKHEDLLVLDEHGRKRKPSRIAEMRRAELIEAAIRDIASKGYDSVTVASICKEAGFSRGLIGHYFDSKDALLFEAVKTMSDRLGNAIRESVTAAGPDVVDRLHALIRASFTPPGFTTDNVAVWVALAGTARWSPPLSRLYQDIWDEYRKRVGRLFARAGEAVGRDIDIQSTTLAFSQLIEGMWIGCNANPQALSPALAEQVCHDYVDLVLGRTSLRT